MKIVVTGASGLLGWHASVLLHSRNCAARFRHEAEPFEIARLDHKGFSDPATLRDAVEGADAVLHYAGVNRAPDDVVERTNPAVAEALLAAVRTAGSTPHIVYANSTHALGDTPYGRSKRRAAESLASGPGGMTNLILPHIFGEGARPYYNNVTATLIDQLIRGERHDVNPDGKVQLLHAGVAADVAVDAAITRQLGEVAPMGRSMSVPDLLDRLTRFHKSYLQNLYPDLADPFDVSLFNSYRAALYPAGFPRPLRLNKDARGTLFEAVKGGGGGQTFLSWTEPGVTRGDHFHIRKIERFLVLEGEAVIRIRRVLGGPVWDYPVSGAEPSVVDMPTLHTHSIENVGATPLLTLFWSNEIFDPANTDTYADPVLRADR
jgi:UDP-2-acetamido-2,6-beta-L-arabino-hexul-4-ose reductase